MSRAHLRALGLSVLVALSAAFGAPYDLTALDDEFDDATSLARWQRHDVVEGWPSQWKALDVNTTSPGHLYVEPYSSAWFAGMRAPYLFKEVTGDFVVTARVLASGRATPVPTAGWSLLGLMIRQPRPSVTPDTWSSSGENWVFLTVGTADDVGAPQIEDKSTTNGASSLRTRPGRAGWVELRVARIGRSVLLLRRFDGEGWAVHRRLDRPNLGVTLQVGVNAYTDNDSLGVVNDALAYNRTVVTQGRPDLVGRVDWVRFARPDVPDAWRGMDLSWNVSDEDLLKVLGR
ncbi:hypothetical protein [Deinococcus pimensis]|uniref:hypothetical protein n=1 Tax=Deinococcus pimensis TaxID=309888 RepID=UPI00048621D4|nr:hypothetical protein [Deinococcus pimensis]